MGKIQGLHKAAYTEKEGEGRRGQGGVATAVDTQRGPAGAIQAHEGTRISLLRWGPAGKAPYCRPALLQSGQRDPVSVGAPSTGFCNPVTSCEIGDDPDSHHTSPQEAAQKVPQPVHESQFTLA